MVKENGHDQQETNTAWSEEKRETKEMDQGEERYVAKLRGMPWSATMADILAFFEGCAIKDGEHGVHLVHTREGRPSGEAFVEFASGEDLESAMGKNKKYMGSRYIEIYKTTVEDMNWVLERSKLEMNTTGSENFLRLRGLPFGCTKEDISNFFTGMQIAPNGIIFVTDNNTGRTTGEAFVKLLDEEATSEALKKHMQKIGHRYIEIFRSSCSEMERAVSADYFEYPGMRPLMAKSIGRPSRVAPYEREPPRYGRGGGARYDDRMGFQGAGSYAAGRYGGSTGYGPGVAYGDDGYTSRGGYGDGSYDDRYQGNFRRGGFMSDYEDDVLPGNRMGMGRPQGGGISGGGGVSGGIIGVTGVGGIGGGGQASLLQPNYEDDEMRGIGGSGGGGWGGQGDAAPKYYTIRMRGLPFRAVETDVVSFFHPVVPLKVKFLYDKMNRPSGEAEVQFATQEEASKSMLKDKANMHNRYIELFLEPPIGVRSVGFPRRF